MSKALRDYYALARKINEFESTNVDNDMLLFSQERYEKKPKHIEPTDETYHDYYYQYLGMTKKLTLHDDLVNRFEYNGEYNPKGLRSKHTTYGLPKKMMSAHENQINQPIFNEQFLNEISKKGYLTMYSNKK